MRDLYTYVNDNGDSLALSAANGYRITSITGTSGIPVSANQAQGVGQIGTTVQSRVVQSVPMTVTGYIFGTRAQIEARAERLFQVVLPDIGAKLYHNGTYYRIVTPTSTPAVDNTLRFPGFQFSLLAPYPYWMLDQATKTILTGVLPRFKFPWNLTKPYRFGEVIETAFINIKNSGQVACPFTATFNAKGPVVNPRLVNAITGEFMRLNRSMTAGERVTVRITHDLTYVTSTIDGDIRGDLELENTLSSMAVGDNLIKTEADEGASNLVVSIDVAIEKVAIVTC
ncbi:MAG: phage tail family protein [Eubacteriales bacterium]|nr:phage tail family protein [Eubacteriales bacterium]